MKIPSGIGYNHSSMRPSIPPFEPSIRRIAVIGTTAAGKSTLAGQLARRIGVPHIEIDSIYWLEDWGHLPIEQLKARVEAATQNEGWVIDGNYSRVREVYWPRLQAVVWLDYSLALILWRLWWRTWRRIVNREHLWGTNYEDFRSQFLSRDSLFLWAFQTYPRHKRDYTQLLLQAQSEHIHVYRFGSPRQAQEWLSAI